MKTNRIPLILIVLAAMACSKVPITNRKQVNLIPESEMMALSNQQYSEMLSQSKVITGTAEAKMVGRAGRNISLAATTLMQELGYGDRVADYRWEYKLIESKEVNAWCLPGGKIAIYSGLLPISKDETGLAVVMGHEVGHAIAKHGNERLSQALMAEMGGIALNSALASKPKETQQLYQAAYGIGATYGALLPFSRAQESEADRLGLILMAKAGYDPHAAIALWERMKALSAGNAPHEFMSTHPSDQRRINDIKEYLPEAMKYYSK